MAKVANLAIPPSLLAQYIGVLRPADRYDQPGTAVQLRGTVFNPTPPDRRPITLQRARVAAAWLGARHAIGMSPRSRRDFETARVNEILARDFAAPYWAPATALYDRTQSVTPLCVLDEGGVAPAYADPARRASWCVYRDVAATYVNPPPETSPPNPSAGWFGDVQATQYQDRWYAQRRFDFSTPVSIGGAGDAPIWADIAATLALSASHRGNRMWASLTLATVSNPFYEPPNPPYERSRAFIRREFVYRLPVSPAATPWAQTITRNLALDLRHAGGAGYEADNRWLVFYIAPTPPHGRYFARNDWCRCWLAAAAAAYYAIGP